MTSNIVTARMATTAPRQLAIRIPALNPPADDCDDPRYP